MSDNSNPFSPVDSLEDVSKRLQNLESVLSSLIGHIDHNIQAINRNNDFFREKLDGTLTLQGRIAAYNTQKTQRIRNFSEIEFQIYSQWGEDGIIEWLVSRLPGIRDYFIEFGVQTFSEANCRFLMLNRNWKGLVMDGAEDFTAQLKSQRTYWRYDLTALRAFVTTENIDGLIVDNGFGGEVGILSIDIDGNDYWVWEAIQNVNPAIVICEYNAVLGDLHAITVPYNPDFTRFEGHYSGIYFGASIMALRHLAEQKGYEFVGTNSHGVNAFFIRRDLASHILPLIEERAMFPSRFRDSRNPDGGLTFTAGAARYDIIKDMPVVEVTTGRTRTLSDLGPAYSQEWLEMMK